MHLLQTHGVVFGLLIFAATAAASEPAKPLVPNASSPNYSCDSIQKLNVLFRQEYSQARNSQLSPIGQVIIVRGDNLILIRNGQRVVGKSVDKNYHDLKAISHSALALFCIIENCVDKPLTVSHIEKLKRLGDVLTEVAGDLEGAFMDPEVRSSQAVIIQRCLGVIESSLQKGQCTSDDLDALIDGLRPLIVANAGKAAQLRLDNYHEQMKRWRTSMSDEEWGKLYVIVPGAVMSRKNSLAVRYFAKLFGQEGEGNRVIYAESQFEESQDLQLLGTHLLDSRIGETFFDDASRMKRDLLGPFANVYLDTLDFDQLR